MELTNQKTGLSTLSLNEIILLKWLLDECYDIGAYQQYPCCPFALKLLPFDFQTHKNILNSLVEKNALSIKQENEGGWRYLLSRSSINTLSNSFDIFNTASEAKIDHLTYKKMRKAN